MIKYGPLPMFKTTVRPIADTDTNTDFVCFVVIYPRGKKEPLL